MLDHEKLDIYNVIVFKQDKALLIRIVSMFTKLFKIRSRVRSRARARKNQELKLIA